MHQDHRLQAQRFELKYLIKEDLAQRLRDFVTGYLVLDDYASGHPDLSYAIHSLYLDSDDLKTHYASVNGERNRFKLRLRYYDERPASPVYFEIKRRADNCILKQRCAVRRPAVAAVLAGFLPEPGQLVTADATRVAALQRFQLLLQRLDARPRVHVHYLREAWVSPHDNTVRVTFDRRIRVEPRFSAMPGASMAGPVQLFPEFVVLEMKFTARFPVWFKTMVERHNLMQGSSSKYSQGVTLLGEHRLEGRPLRALPGASAAVGANVSGGAWPAAWAAEGG
jgi:SPX domain protein involved in polyphosphate accumulation